uniref:BrnT family toxin n=1 Tax=Candidatus Kentrum sp. LFY TaxID=2126342 RepID=A0A450V7J9_9GAMM|nr:MAG: hypothetical protein BECKLFY1418A_GA0070994_11265 [Candidatus Kentron sp. LFY]
MGGEMKFEWDDNKARTNFAKHGISFEEATTGFEDPLFIDFFDPDYSQDECRYILLGYSDQMRLLLISYTKEE